MPPAHALADGYLYNAQPRGGDAHLHLEVPAKRLLAHAEVIEHAASDGAERRHIGKPAHRIALE